MGYLFEDDDNDGYYFEDNNTIKENSLYQCPYCGEVISSRDEFCQSCGKLIDWENDEL